jgi:hypothetical protein
VYAYINKYIFELLSCDFAFILLFGTFLNSETMKYNLFIDESGDHGLSNLNPNFPIFLLCGIVISEKEYDGLKVSFNKIKETIWKSKNVIFHSRDIRKCEKEFKYLFDLSLKAKFYSLLDGVIRKTDYKIVASAINKPKYIKLYGRLSDDVYEISLSFIIEQAVFYLESLKGSDNSLNIIIEKRGFKEDKKLDEHFQRILSRGTGYVTPGKLSKFNLTIDFKNKNENINGLQVADLVAYPIARHVMEPQRVNPAFDIFKEKIYSKLRRGYGLKIFP